MAELRKDVNSRRRVGGNAWEGEEEGIMNVDYREGNVRGLFYRIKFQKHHS